MVSPAAILLPGLAGGGDADSDRVDLRRPFLRGMFSGEEERDRLREDRLLREDAEEDRLWGRRRGLPFPPPPLALVSRSLLRERDREEEEREVEREEAEE